MSVCSLPRSHMIRVWLSKRFTQKHNIVNFLHLKYLPKNRPNTGVMRTIWNWDIWVRRLKWVGDEIGQREIKVVIWIKLNKHKAKQVWLYLSQNSICNVSRTIYPTHTTCYPAWHDNLVEHVIILHHWIWVATSTGFFFLHHHRCTNSES